MQTTVLAENASLKFQENFFELSEEEVEMLWEMCPSERHEIKMMGKMIKIPRFQRAFGKSYKYSGTEIVASPVPELIQKIANKIQEIFPGYKFDNVLANWYLDGSQYIGFHSDNVSPFVEGAPIVGVSFSEGASRKLVIKKIDRSKKTNPTVTSIKMSNGCMFAMAGSEFQQKFQHGLPKQKNAGRRISFTFRCFK